MEKLADQFEEIIYQLENKNTEFAISLKNKIDSISNTIDSEKIQTHLNYLALKCIKEPGKARNIFKYYLLLLKSVPPLPSSNIPVQDSKLLSFLNLSTNARNIVRIFPGQELKHSINSKEFFIKLEKADPCDARNNIFKIFIRESNFHNSRILVLCNKNVIMPQQFYIIKNALMKIESTNELDIEVEFFPYFFTQIEEKGLNIQHLESKKYKLQDNSMNYVVENDKIIQKRPMFGQGFAIKRNESSWTIDFQADCIYFYLGNPFNDSFHSEYFDLSSQGSEFYIDSNTIKVEIINETL